MAPLSGKLRVCKWAGTVGCVLIVVAFLISGWWGLFLWWASKEHGYYWGGVAHGFSDFGYMHASPRPGWELRFEPYSSRKLQLPWIKERSIDWPQYGSATLRPVVEWQSRPDGRYCSVALPLWLPFLVLLIPTLLLWRRDRRKPRPGFCRRCDYDLTGNTTGRCPECGTAITL